MRARVQQEDLVRVRARARVRVRVRVGASVAKTSPMFRCAVSSLRRTW